MDHRLLSALVAALLLPVLAVAQDLGTPPPPLAQLDPVNVIGSKDAVAKLPGSAAFLDREDITRQGYDDINRVLREIPGVYVREEDGFGLFPNISIRGGDPGRSSKVTLMEDGILAAPAPYAAPAAYYSPTIGRMSGLEVIKGSSQVRFGPHTTGGVVNYLSTAIPETRAGYLRSALGSDSELRNHLWLGDRFDTGVGQVGFLFELNHRRTDGFKDIDTPVSDQGPSAGDSGFVRLEPLVKLSWQPATRLDQRLELKLGQSEMDADETYLGLTTADLRRNATRRYSASQFDNIETLQRRAHIRYSVAPATGTDIQLTGYYNRFQRNWFKIFDVNAGNGNVALGRALADPDRAAELSVLRGAAAGSFRNRNNNRKYYANGVDLALMQRFNTGPLAHALRVGARQHYDAEERFQNNVTFFQNDDGIITGREVAAPGSQDDRTNKARARSAYVEDAIDLGRLTVTPGLRIEHIDWTIEDRRPGRTPRRDGAETYVMGGVGFNYAAGGTLRLFGGVHQGFSPPSPADGISGGDEEKSVSAELGARWSNAGIAQELVLFGTRFDNLIVADNLGASGGASAEVESVGEVDSYGVEYLTRADLGQMFGWRWGVPVALAATWTRAEIANESTSAGDAESIFNGGRKGARLPYVPDWQLSASLGLERGRWTLNSRLLYVDGAFATALNTRDEVILDRNGDLVPDARGGRIDSYAVIDLSANLQATPAISIFGNVFNLFDREYLASRLPEGPRPGTPRTLLLGVQATLF